MKVELLGRSGSNVPKNITDNPCFEMCQLFKETELNEPYLEVKLVYFSCKTTNDSNTENINDVDRSSVTCTIGPSTSGPITSGPSTSKPSTSGSGKKQSI